MMTKGPDPVLPLKNAVDVSVPAVPAVPGMILVTQFPAVFQLPVVDPPHVPSAARALSAATRAKASKPAAEKAKRHLRDSLDGSWIEHKRGKYDIELGRFLFL